MSKDGSFGELIEEKAKDLEIEKLKREIKAAIILLREIREDRWISRGLIPSINGRIKTLRSAIDER